MTEEIRKALEILSKIEYYSSFQGSSLIRCYPNETEYNFAIQALKNYFEKK